MGILITATTIFLMTSNTNGTVIAQSSNNASGDEYKVTISQLPKQTAVVSRDVTLSNNDRVQANKNIPDIGSGILLLVYDPYHDVYNANIQNIPGQTGGGHSDGIPSDDVIGYTTGYPPKLHPIDIPGIGFGLITLTNLG